MSGDADLQLISRALERDPTACRALVDRLTPAIQNRVNGALIRRGRASRADVLDGVQDILRLLFEDDGKILRAWDPARGASLEGYVKLVTERRLASRLRSGRKSGWAERAVDPERFETLEGDPSPEARAESRQILGQVLDALRRDLSDQGYRMFELIWVEDREVDSIVADTGLARGAVYAWKTRIKKAISMISREVSSDPELSPRRVGRDGGAP